MAVDITRRVAQRIRRLRQAAGLSIEALAERAGIPSETLARVERGEASPRLRTVGLIAAGLGVDPVALFWTDSSVQVPVAVVPEHVNEIVRIVAGRPADDVSRAVAVLRAMFPEDAAQQ